MSTIPTWFWAFFTFNILVLCGIAIQLHRIERKIGWVWRYIKGEIDD